MDTILDRLSDIATDLTGLEREQLDPSVPLVELGFDSLVLTQMAQRLRTAFGVSFAFRDFLGAVRTLGAVAARIQELAGPGAVAAEASAPDGASGVAVVAPPLVPDPGDGASWQQDGLAAVLQQQLALLQGQLDLISREVGRGNAAPSAPPAAVAKPASPAPAPHQEPPATPPPPVEDGLTPHQEAQLVGLTEEWSARTAGSKALTDRDRPHHADPRTAAGFDSRWKELVYPLVIARSLGPHIWDVDGNRYVDLLNGFGPGFFGHSPPFILEALRSQLEAGFEIGPQTPLAGETARLVCELTGIDRAAFVCSGSEAVQTALRMARTYTGRDKIVLFAGAYHGNFDEVLVRGIRSKGQPRAVPAAPGIPGRAVDDVVVLEYGTDRSLEEIRALAPRLAAVLVEPVQSRQPELQPAAFLRELRAVTRAHGALLVFDEVVTGFRCHPGGAQAVFGVEADLVTYGKVLGGGMPIGVVGGRRPYIDVLDGGPWRFGDDSTPTEGVTFSAGTFVRHPLAIAAAHATLRYLRAAGPDLQEAVNARTADLAARLAAAAAALEAPVEVPRFSSIMYFRPTDARCRFNALFFHLMRRHGVYLLEGFPSYLTVSHGEEQLAEVEAAFRAAVLGMREMGLWPERGADAGPRPPVDFRPAERLAAPPAPGARLGRDRDGSAAWFVEDPDRPGAYIRVG